MRVRTILGMPFWVAGSATGMLAVLIGGIAICLGAIGTVIDGEAEEFRDLTG